MVQRKATTATLDNSYQEKYEPMYWAGMRVRTLFHYVVFPAMALGLIGGAYKAASPKITFSNPFAAKASTESINKYEKLSELKFSRPYNYGHQKGALDELAEKNASYQEAVAVMSKAYHSDTLTTKQVYNMREDAMYDSAVSKLRSDLDIGKLVAKDHILTSEYGKRKNPWKRKGVKDPKAAARYAAMPDSVVHHGIDYKFLAKESVSSKKTLFWDEAGKSNNGTVNYVRVIEEGGKRRWTVRHNEAMSADNEYGIKPFKQGDVIPAGTPFAINDGLVGKQYLTTGTDSHFELEIKTKNGWAKSNPTKGSAQFKHSPGFSAKRAKVDPFMAENLKNADGDSFKRIQSKIDVMETYNRAQLKHVVNLSDAYTRYSKTVKHDADSMINASIDKDQALLAVLFSDNNTGASTAAVKTKIDTHSATTQTASIGGFSLNFLSKKKDDKAASVTTTAANVAKDEKAVSTPAAVKLNVNIGAKEVALESFEHMATAQTDIEPIVDKHGVIRYKYVPVDSMRKWLAEDKYWQQLAVNVGRPVEDVADVFTRVVGAESGFKPDAKAKDLRKVDKDGKPIVIKRSAAGFLGLVKGSRNGAADQIGMEWPSHNKLSTMQGIKDQISIEGKYGLDVESDLDRMDPNGKIRNRMYLDKATGRFKVESKLSALVNAWGPGVGAYIDMREDELDNAKQTHTGVPVFCNKLYASGQMQDFSRYTHFVPSTDTERAWEQHITQKWQHNKVGTTFTFKPKETHVQPSSSLQQMKQNVSTSVCVDTAAKAPVPLDPRLN